MTFDDLGLEPNILKAVLEAGYTIPTPIQIAAIPEALKGRDVLGIAQTGTGKTASFTLPMIQRLAKGRARARMPRTLVLCPTRELAAQVSENFEKYGKYHKLSMALLIGGVSFGDQDIKVTRGVDVLIATPGRLLDHFERGKLLLNGIEVMVVDEADRMLDMGFIPDIERIFKLTPMTRQTLFFSATMPPEIKRITDTFLRDPVRIEVARQATTAETITQRIVRLPSSDDRLKRMTLRKLLDMESVRNGLIFCNRKSTVDVLAKSLQTHGYNARPIHGDLAQSFRTETIEKFRSGEVTFVIASDVAARGLDIPDVSHVFNYDAPFHPEDYVHRIGRTGRAGKSGTALTLVAPSDEKFLRGILATIRSEGIEELDLGDFFAGAQEDVKARGDREPSRKRSGERGGDRGAERGRSGGRSNGRSGGRPESKGDRPPREGSARSETRREMRSEPQNDTRIAPRDPAPETIAAFEAPAARPAERPRAAPERARAPSTERQRGEPREKVKGFGSDVPAFMAR
ncbi:MAG: DEAD/DEAH box helicase [Parvularculaceae bacterium]